MKLKDSLAQYCDTREEIKELEKKIQKLENSYITTDVVETSSAVFPFTQRTLKIEGRDYSKQRTLCLYKDLLKTRYDKLLLQQLKVEEFINELPTSRLRRIFEYRYICQFSWSRVAIEINKNKKGNYVTDESIRKEHDRFLEKN